jgi:hypothetical protein
MKESSCAAHAPGVGSLSNRWGWAVILVEVLSIFELPVSELPTIADIAWLA